MNKIFHRTPVSLIAEDIKFVNRRLGKNQYFYIDIQREGIVLFDSGELELAEPRAEMPPKERAMLAQRATSFEPQFLKAFPMGTDEQKPGLNCCVKLMLMPATNPALLSPLKN